MQSKQEPDEDRERGNRKMGTMKGTWTSSMHSLACTGLVLYIVTFCDQHTICSSACLTHQSSGVSLESTGLNLTEREEQ